jgi:hypothetical protein
MASATEDLKDLAEGGRKLEVLRADVRDLDYEFGNKCRTLRRFRAGKKLPKGASIYGRRSPTLSVRFNRSMRIGYGSTRSLRALKVEEESWAKAEHEASKGRSLAS